MKLPVVEYMRWAKAQAPARINLAASAAETCPPSALGLTSADCVTSLPGEDGYAPLNRAIARRYRVNLEQVFAVSGGTSFVNWCACAVALDGAPRGTEVIVEQPTYEPLLRVPQAFGCTIRRFERSFADEYAVELSRFTRLVNRRTRLAIVSNLHNPSGARIPQATLRAMAAALDRVGGLLLVDEVYLEGEFGSRPESSVHAGRNVMASNSLSKAYGLSGLRAGWLLGPRDIIERAWRMQDVLGVKSVAPGERMALVAFRRLPALRRRAHDRLDPNFERVKAFLARERRIQACVPEGGNLLFPRLAGGIDGERFADRLLTRYSTLVVPGRFFESPRHFRMSFGVRPAILAQGLANISRALDDVE